jgi:hypothetical protein
MGVLEQVAVAQLALVQRLVGAQLLGYVAGDNGEPHDPPLVVARCQKAGARVTARRAWHADIAQGPAARKQRPERVDERGELGQRLGQRAADQLRQRRTVDGGELRVCARHTQGRVEKGRA